MKIVFKRQYSLGKPCVAKLWFGDRYLVVKARDVRASARELIQACHGGQQPADGFNRYVIPRVIRVVRQANREGIKCIVEILLVSSRAEELLAKEQAALNHRDRKCLNANTIVDKPLWIFQYLVSRSVPAYLFRLVGRHRAAPAVVRLLVDDRYFIWKCKDLHEFPAKFSESMQRNIHHNNAATSGYLHPLVTYMADHPQATCLIDVVHKGQLTKAGVRKLLRLEKRLLDQHTRKGKCLNRSRRQYIPEWVELILHPKSNIDGNQK